MSDDRLGVKVRVFHLGDYRREVLGSQHLPQDYFWAKANDETVSLRQQILDKCRNDLLDFFDVEKGQVAIYDAVNPTSKNRRDWKEAFDKKGIQTIFIESMCDNPEIIEQNVRSVKISSPDVLSLVSVINSSMWVGIQMMRLKITLLALTQKYRITNRSVRLISHTSK
jgi:6-phosphofructo-2-kinase / fructose-2,6-biphosphatase 4